VGLSAKEKLPISPQGLWALLDVLFPRLPAPLDLLNHAPGIFPPSQAAWKGADVVSLEAYIQAEADHASSIWREKTMTRWRRSEFLVHAGRQSVANRWAVATLRRVQGGGPRGAHVLAWGVEASSQGHAKATLPSHRAH
jgi:hypothetical protein